MTDTALILAAAAVATGVWVSRYVSAAVRAGRSVGGVRLVTCPETGRPAAVTLDRLHAAFTALTDHEPDVHLAGCSRWPERGPCDEPCLPEAVVPEKRVSNLVARWSARKHCALCGNAVVEEPLLRHHVGLLSPDGLTIEWPDVAPTALPEALRTHRPVCWDCHIAQTFRRSRPELITDR